MVHRIRDVYEKGLWSSVYYFLRRLKSCVLFDKNSWEILNEGDIHKTQQGMFLGHS